MKKASQVSDYHKMHVTIHNSSIRQVSHKCVTNKHMLTSKQGIITQKRREGP